MKISTSCFALFATLALTIHPALSQEDIEGGQDVPYFTRMPNFYISEMNNKDFDAYQLFDGKKLVAVEGKIYQTTYYQKTDVTPVSELQIRRNFITAIKNMGGSIVVEGKSALFEDTRAQSILVIGKVVKGAKEIWVEVWPWENSYTLTVVEKEQMRQEISATDMLDALNKDGFVALDIHFDTGKSTIRDESRPMIDQIVTLLTDNGDLKLSIEGHTDNAGDAKSNKTLSEQRAKSVMDALTKAGVDGKRLSAIGYGQDRPVADNRNEEGRAKNRRVELVKK
jgi:outer membrane protein OmpA-like peptidoglycan-associated protein